jgi:hypothetical protein
MISSSKQYFYNFHNRLHKICIIRLISEYLSERKRDGGRKGNEF